MISLAAEPIAHIGPITITNTLVDTLLVDAILIWLAWYISKHASVIPSLFQSAVEMVVQAFYDLIQTVSEKQVMRIFPYVTTFFLFIMISNFSGLFPVLTSLGFYHHGEHGTEFIPLFRSASTDLNVTMALALVSLVATHSMSITTLGFKQYIGRFLSLNPLQLYTGLLELISEFTKIISFSFRLFGNIFVGEVMLVSISTAAAVLLPVPLIFYELFVGTVQAAIFALLTMAFMAIFTTPHGAEAKEH